MSLDGHILRHCTSVYIVTKTAFNFTWYPNILIYIQQDATLLSLFYLETALHVSGGTIIHHQERKNCIYSIWYLSHRYCYLPLSWNWFECAVAGVCHPQHTQTSSNSSTRATGSSNGVTNTRCCSYSCLRSR